MGAGELDATDVGGRLEVGLVEFTAPGTAGRGTR
jgi:hypothetical protein